MRLTKLAAPQLAGRQDPVEELFLAPHGIR
jgi:hypothetical protein